MINLTYLVRRILDTALSESNSVVALETFKESYTHQSDGTDLLMVDGVSRLQLADEYIAEHGKEAFIRLLDNSGDLNGAIYNAANATVCDQGVQASFEIIELIIEAARRVKASPGFAIKNIRITNGNSVLDHFPPKRVVGGCEQYRDIEGSGNFDLYRSTAEIESARYKYNLEVELTPI